MVDKLGPFVGTDFLKVFFFFTFLPVTLNLAYFALLNGAGQIFPVNFKYPRCLENSYMINFCPFVVTDFFLFFYISLFCPG